MKTICVITATRAEYGLLYPLIKLIDNDKDLDLQLIVSGTHLKKESGYTKKEIVKDGFPIAAEFDILEDNDGENAISKAMGRVLTEFSGYLTNHRPDMAIVLGDRYEMMAFAVALINEKIPIAHLNGGETTEGAIDEIYRHCITKMSMYHFVNCEIHRKRVIQLGDNPNRVFNVGDICVDNVVQQSLLSADELKDFLHMDFLPDNLAIVTYHPVTFEDDSLKQVKILLNVLKENDNYFYLFTKVNADSQGDAINKYLQNNMRGWKNARLVDSLGRIGYLSALKHAKMVIGNSSSGIYEAPIFKIPTVNIGNRQKGRIHGTTVIDCVVGREEINSAIKLAESDPFQKNCKESKNLFGDGYASNRIIIIIKEILKKGCKVQKKFYDLG